MTSAATIWAIESYRAGETSQILGLAEGLQRALGWAIATKGLHYTSLAGPAALLRVISLAGVAPETRQSLRPPWPDVLILAGARNEPVGRWVKCASGGHTRIVFLGRTWAPVRHFDLLVTTPQYRVKPAANVLENSTTLHRVHAARLAGAKEEWRPFFAHLPGPLTAVLVGGDSGPFALRVKSARQLGAALEQSRRNTGGTLLITTSSRTHPSAIDALAEALPDAWLYRWRPSDPSNPYFGLLAWADGIVVTSDSIAMISEAQAVGVPVALFDLSQHHDATSKTRTYAWLMRLGPERLSRDIGIAHERMIAAGRIHRLGEPQQPLSGAPQEDALARTVARIAELVAKK